MTRKTHPRPEDRTHRAEVELEIRKLRKQRRQKFATQGDTEGKTTVFVYSHNQPPKPVSLPRFKCLEDDQC